MIATEYGYPPSGVDPFTLQGRDFFVKRDDLVDPRYSGNKLRKLTTLLTLPSQTYTTLVSHGGAQSNAMLAIAHLARAKGWAFHYWCKRLPERVRDNPAGNLAEALRLGMRLHEVPRDRYEERVAALRGMAKGPDLLFIPQGGADPIAEAGVARLAGEVTAWAEEAGVTRFTVATPSGTGTTAFYLRKHLPDRVEVVTTPAVGDARVLEAQWNALEEGAARRPRILMRRPKWPFAKPNRDYLAIWRACEKAGILFDLLYAPKMWLELLAHYDELPRPILYIHSGGTSGNATQLEKYRYKGWL